MKMKSIGLKKAIQVFGGTEIELHKGYHYQYGFFVKDGRLYYINSGDDRMRRSDGQLNVYHRTAEHRKDWTGGPNLWWFVSALNGMGYRIDKAPTDTRKMRLVKLANGETRLVG